MAEIPKEEENATVVVEDIAAEPTPTDEVDTDVASTAAALEASALADASEFQAEDLDALLTEAFSKDRLLMLRLCQAMEDFFNQPLPFFTFGPLDPYQRKICHSVAAYYSLEHHPDGTGRGVIFRKTPQSHPDSRLRALAASSPAAQPASRVIIARRSTASPPTTPLGDAGGTGANGSQTKQGPETMEERQERYRQIRERIFADFVPEDPVDPAAVPAPGTEAGAGTGTGTGGTGTSAAGVAGSEVVSGDAGSGAGAPPPQQSLMEFPEVPASRNSSARFRSGLWSPSYTPDYGTPSMGPSRPPMPYNPMTPAPLLLGHASHVWQGPLGMPAEFGMRGPALVTPDVRGFSSQMQATAAVFVPQQPSHPLPHTQPHHLGHRSTVPSPKQHGPYAVHPHTHGPHLPPHAPHYVAFPTHAHPVPHSTAHQQHPPSHMRTTPLYMMGPGPQPHAHAPPQHGQPQYMNPAHGPVQPSVRPGPGPRMGMYPPPPQGLYYSPEPYSVMYAPPAWGPPPPNQPSPAWTVGPPTLLADYPMAHGKGQWKP